MTLVQIDDQWITRISDFGGWARIYFSAENHIGVRLTVDQLRKPIDD